MDVLSEMINAIDPENKEVLFPMKSFFTMANKETMKYKKTVFLVYKTTMRNFYLQRYITCNLQVVSIFTLK